MKIYLFSFLGTVALIAFIIIGSFVNHANYGNRTEVLIKNTYENNQNILAQYGQKISESVQVPDMYKGDLKEVTVAAISGRYGDGGSKAVFQFLKEQNPTLDASLYKQIQQIIESGRNEFQASQTQLIDIRRQYETELGYIWGGFWLKLAGYPKIDLVTMYKPITTDRAADAFKSGKEAPMQLRK